MSASGGKSSWDVISEANTRYQNELFAVFGAGIAGAVYQFWASFVAMIQAGFNLIVSPLDALGLGVGDIVMSITGGAAAIITASVNQTINNLLNLGPFNFAQGIAAALAGALVIMLFLRLEWTSDLIPFTFTDVPPPLSWLGFGVPEDDEDEG